MAWIKRRKLALILAAAIAAVIVVVPVAMYLNLPKPISAACPVVPTDQQSFNVGLAAGDVFTNMSADQIDQYMSRAQALCVHVVRVDMKWDKAEPVEGNGYDLSQWQTIVAAAERHDIYLRGIVDSAPEWAVSSDCLAQLKDAWRCAPRDDSDDGGSTVQAMADFAKAATAAARGRLLKVEVANEPNSMPEFAHDPQRYVQLYQAVRTAVKSADAKVAVGPGGTAAVGHSNVDGEGLSAPDWYQKLCEAGICSQMDFVAVHPYDWPMFPSGFDPLWAQIGQVHSILATAGAGRTPIDLTEMGFPTGGTKARMNETMQALAYKTTFSEFDKLRAAGVAGELDIFSLQDNASVATRSVEAHFGIERADGTPKAAWAVVHNYAYNKGF